MDSFYYKNHYVTIQRKSKNKNTYIRVASDGNIAVTTPYHINNQTLMPFIDQFINKIENKYDLSKMKKAGYEDQDTIYYLGQPYQIKVQSTKGKEYCFIDNQIMYVLLKDINDEEKLNKQINAFFQNQAKKILTERFFEIVKQFKHIDFEPKLKIRSLKSKYGSCYYKRNEVILANQLVHYDYECIDYVIVHELAHFIQPNHSKKFYYLVSQYLPNYKNAEYKLKDRL